MQEFRERHTIEYTENEYEELPDGSGRRLVRTITNRCQVEIVIDLQSLVKVMGVRAALNKSGRCVDGFVTVRMTGLGRGKDVKEH